MDGSRHPGDAGPLVETIAEKLRNAGMKQVGVSYDDSCLRERGAFVDALWVLVGESSPLRGGAKSCGAAVDDALRIWGGSLSLERGSFFRVLATVSGLHLTAC